LGGPHPTLFPKQTAEDRAVDFVVKDEGEDTMLELVRALENNKTDFKDIRSITYKSNGKIIDNSPRPSVDLDKLPFIDWGLCNEKVRQGFKKGKLIRVLTNKGCTFKCTFCIHASTMNRKMRYRSPEKVLDEIERNMEVYDNVKRMGLRDELAFINIKHSRQICEGIINKKLNFKWIALTKASFFREGHLDDKFLSLATKAGLEKLGIGAESGSQKILDFIKKGITVQHIINSVKKMKEFGIVPMLSFMSGFPGETHEDLKATMRLMKILHDINPEYEISGPNLLRPYPGGEMYDFLVKEYGYSNPSTFREWAKRDYASEARLSWVKDIDLYKYIGVSLRYARQRSYENIVRECGFNLPRLVLQIMLKNIWTWRFEHSNYSYPLDYKLYATYFRSTHGYNPDQN
jgi:radical SAM superfamily enzyme YgiQ (UPF0313 family)